MIDIDHPAIQVGIGSLFGQHPERGGQERAQAVFAVLNSVIEAGYLVEPCHTHLPNAGYQKACTREDLDLSNMPRGEGTHEMKFPKDIEGDTHNA